MKKIGKILVPTDFSVTARNAYHYATKLAATLNTSIELVHVTETYVPFPGLASHEEVSQDSIDGFNEKAMEDFIADDDNNNYEAFGTTVLRNRVTSKTIWGNVVENLITLSKDTDLIVMGTTGLQDFLSKIMGSISLEVSNKAHCPVLLVPPDAKWQRISRIMYAGSYSSATIKMVREVTSLAHSLQSTIHFVHVENSEADTEKNVPELLKNRLSLVEGSDFPIEIHTVYDGDTVAGLKKYAVENTINLMVFVCKPRNFWQNLIFKSIAEDVALSTDTPMMVLHSDDSME